MSEYDDEKKPGTRLGLLELLREEAILARLDPDQDGTEPPPGTPANEWAEFLALCKRTYPDG